MASPESRVGGDQSHSSRDEALYRDLLSHETNPFHESYPCRVGFRETPGGQLLNRPLAEVIDHNTRMAADREYMLEHLRADGSLIGTINDRWAIALPIAGYDAQHITIFRLPQVARPGSFPSRNPHLPIEQPTNLADHSEQEKKEFLEIGKYLLCQLEQLDPDTHYVFGVNRSLRPRHGEGIGGQSIPILHGHIFPTLRSTETQVPFREAYRVNDQGADATARNERLLKLRASRPALEFASRLADSINGYSALIARDDPDFSTAIADRWLEVKMNPDIKLNWRYLSWVIASAEGVFGEMEHSPIKTYSWTIDSKGNMRIGLTPYSTGVAELHNIVLDRTQTTVSEAFSQQRDKFRSTIEQLFPQLQQAAYSSEPTEPTVS